MRRVATVTRCVDQTDACTRRTAPTSRHARTARSRNHPPRHRAVSDRPARASASILRRPDLRWPIPPRSARCCPASASTRWSGGRNTCCCTPRSAARCCIWACRGVLRVLPPDDAGGQARSRRHRAGSTPAQAPRILRFTDPRRFGCLLWQPPGETHDCWPKLGPEPLTDAFDGDLLWQRSRGRTAAVKLFLMDNAIVVGVGNIYASEALFAAGIDPRRAAGDISRARYARLAIEVKRILALGDRARRHHLARLPQSRRRARLFLPRTDGLRPRRRTVPCLRHADPAGHAGAALDVLVPALPALKPDRSRPPSFPCGNRLTTSCRLRQAGFPRLTCWPWIAMHSGHGAPRRVVIPAFSRNQRKLPRSSLFLEKRLFRTAIPTWQIHHMPEESP